MTELKPGTKGTLYYPMRRCMQCFHICENHLTKCPQCNLTFVRECTELERQEINEKLRKLEEKRDDEDN